MFANDPTAVWNYLAPLLAHAMDIIPPSLHHETPLFLLATAGMRLLDMHQQHAIIEATCMFFRTNSIFRLEPLSNIGPCGSSIRIISGEEEGLFGWIAVNYLMDGFASHEENHRATYGFLDMGGASTQIAFEPSEPEKAHSSKTTLDNLVEVRLRLLGGEEIQHRVFVTTWLGYGTNQARERYLGQEVVEWEAHSEHGSEAPIPDPCLPKGLILDEYPMPDNSPPDSHSRKLHRFLGQGSFAQCVKETAPLLNKTVPCHDSPCLFNGVPAPKIDFSLSKFVGVSEYWYSSQHVFGLGGTWDYVEYERAATKFCLREWNDIMTEYNRTRLFLKGKVVEENGEVFRWGKEVGLNRLEMQCFKAAWIVNVLHEGIGMPRIVDPGGNITSHEMAQAGEKAHDKHLDGVKFSPAFQSVDTIGGTAISWTLGKIVLEASKEVPPLSHEIPPLSDPDPHGHGAAGHSPFRDSRHGGLSMQAAFPVVFLLVAALAYVLRRLLRAYLRRSRRRVAVVEGEQSIGFFDYHSSEEGGGSGQISSSSGSSTPITPRIARSTSRSSVFRSVRRLFHSLRRPSQPRRPKSRSDAQKPSTATTMRAANTHPYQTSSFFQIVPQPTKTPSNRISPTPRTSNKGVNSTMSPSRSLASIPRPNLSRVAPSRTLSGNVLTRSGAVSATLSSRVSSSGSENADDSDEQDEPGTARPTGLQSRSSLQLPYDDLSRNSSQVNLTTAVSRSLASSRTPTNSSFGQQWSTHD